MHKNSDLQTFSVLKRSCPSECALYPPRIGSWNPKWKHLIRSYIVLGQWALIQRATDPLDRQRGRPGFRTRHSESGTTSQSILYPSHCHDSRVCTRSWMHSILSEAPSALPLTGLQVFCVQLFRVLATIWTNFRRRVAFLTTNMAVFRHSFS